MWWSSFKIIFFVLNFIFDLLKSYNVIKRNEWYVVINAFRLINKVENKIDVSNCPELGKNFTDMVEIISFIFSIKRIQLSL